MATEGAPGMKVTVPPVFETGEVIDSVFTSAFVDFKVQVDTPDVLVAVQALNVLLVPVALGTGI